jgi:hypothetical protein
MSDSMVQMSFNVLQMTIEAHFSRFEGYITILDKGEILSSTYAEMFKTLLDAAEEEIITDLDNAKHTAIQHTCHRICSKDKDEPRQTPGKNKDKGGDSKE